MSFGLTVKTAFPRPQSDGFPQGIQWQADGIDLGDRHVQTVDLRLFGSGGVTRDADTLTIIPPQAAEAPSPAPSPSESPGVTQGAFSIGSASDTIDLLAQGFSSTDPVDYWVWVQPLSGGEWVPVMPPAALQNDPGLPTFAISSGDMSFSGLVGFSEGGSVLIRQLGPAGVGG